MRPCASDGCPNHAPYLDGGGLCPKHWQRWRKFGDAQYVTPAKRPKVEVPCAIPECSDVARLRGWCKTHYNRWLRNGDPLVVKRQGGWTGEAVTYRALHKRLERQNGPATLHSCFDCGKRAAQWSYQGGDSGERVERGLAYTPNMDAYVARCVSCHKRLDDPNPVGLTYRWPSRRRTS